MVHNIHVPSAIPEIQHEVPHELDVAVLDVDSGTQSADILGDIVAEDNASHGRLARATFAHQQHLALLLTLLGIHREGMFDRRCGSEYPV